jgi:flagellar biosynthesis GTPase FlhF
MATTTVTAKDTSRAMEDIIDRLGEDAVILSTNQKNGKVEMTATNDSSSIPPKRLKPSQQFSKIFESRMLNEQISGGSDNTLELTQAVNQSDGASSSQLSAVRSELKEIKNMLSGVVVTEPQNLNDKVASSTALRLRQAGFSSKIVNILDQSILNKDYENARVSFLRSLAKRLVPNDIQNLNQSKIYYVIGSSGSGRTTLSAKIAAYFAERSESKKY